MIGIQLLDSNCILHGIQLFHEEGGMGIIYQFLVLSRFEQKICLCSNSNVVCGFFLLIKHSSCVIPQLNVCGI